MLDRQADFAMLAVQGPRARSARRGLSDGQLPRALPLLRAHRRRARRCSSAAPATPARTGSSCCCAPDQAERVWAGAARRGRDARSGSARATRCGSRRASTCTATTSTRTATRSAPGSAGAAPRRRDSSAPTRSPLSGPASPDSELVPFVIDGPGIARQGNPVCRRHRPRRAGGEVTSGSFSPCLERGIGMAYVSAERAEPGTRLADRRARHIREAVVETQAPVPKGS